MHNEVGIAVDFYGQLREGLRKKAVDVLNNRANLPVQREVPVLYGVDYY